jgi:hypothetical protein
MHRREVRRKNKTKSTYAIKEIPEKEKKKVKKSRSVSAGCSGRTLAKKQMH